MLSPLQRVNADEAGVFRRGNRFMAGACVIVSCVICVPYCGHVPVGQGYALLSRRRICVSTCLVLSVKSPCIIQP